MKINSMEQLKTLPVGKTFIGTITMNGREQRARIGIENDSFFIYARKKRYNGYRYSSFNQVTSFTIPDVTEEETWKKSWKKVLKMLEESGLWENMKSDVEMALSIGYEKIKKAYNATHEYDRDHEKEIEVIRAIDERLIEKSPEGKEYYDTSIIWYMHIPAKVKTMYFGKYYNKHHLASIALAMKENRKFTASEEVNYDVSFEYNPEANKAWYSEEFRGCGSGHYYLALNSTHALFYEDD
jgi:hypothetical protein